MSVRKTRKILKANVSLSDSTASTSINGSMSSSLSASYKDELEAMFSEAPSIKELRKKAYLDKSRNSSNSSLSKSGSSTPTQEQNVSSNSVLSQSRPNNEPVFKKPILKNYNELDFSLKGLNVSLDTSSVKSPKRVFGITKKKPKISVDINPLSLENSYNENSSDLDPQLLKKYLKNVPPAGLNLTNNSDFERSLNESSDQNLKDRMLKKKSFAKRKSLHLNNTSLENTINELEIDNSNREENYKKEDDIPQPTINEKTITTVGKIFDLDNPEVKLDLNEKYLDNNKQDCLNRSTASENISNICDPDTDKLSETCSADKGDLGEPNVNEELVAEESISHNVVNKNLSTVSSSQCTKDAIETQPDTCNENIYSQNNMPPAEDLNKPFPTSSTTGLNDSSINDKNPLGQTFIVSQPCTPSLPVCNTTDTTFTVLHPKRFKCSEMGLHINGTVADECVIDNTSGTNKEPNGSRILETNEEHKNYIDNKQSAKNQSVEIPTNEEPNDKQLDNFELGKKNSINNEGDVLVNLNKVTSNEAYQDKFSPNIKESVVHKNNSNDNDDAITHSNSNKITISKEKSIADIAYENRCSDSDKAPVLNTELVDETMKKSKLQGNVNDPVNDEDKDILCDNMVNKTSECVKEAGKIQEDNTYAEISSQNGKSSDIELKNPSLSLNLTGLNDTFKNMDKSLDTSEAQNPPSQLLRKSIKQKKKSLRLSDASLLTSTRKSAIFSQESNGNSNENDNYSEISSQNDGTSGGILKKPSMPSNLTSLNDSTFKNMEKSVDITDTENQIIREFKKSVNRKKKSVRLSDASLLTSTRKSAIFSQDNDEKSNENDNYTEISSQNDGTSGGILKKPSMPSNLLSLNDSTFKNMEKSVDSTETENQIIRKFKKSVNRKKKSVRLSDASLLLSTRKSAIFSQDNEGNSNENYNYSEISSQNDGTSGGILKKPSMPSNLTSLNDTTFKNMEKSVDITETENPIIREFKKSVNRKKRSVRLSDASLLMSHRESIDPSSGAAIVHTEEPNANSMIGVQEQGQTESNIVRDSVKLSTCGEEKGNAVHGTGDIEVLSERNLSVINHEDVNLSKESSNTGFQDQDISTNSSSISAIDENTSHVNNSRCVEITSDTQGPSNHTVNGDVISKAEDSFSPAADENHSSEKHLPIVETIVKTPAVNSERPEENEGINNSNSLISSQNDICSALVLKKPALSSNLTVLNDSSFRNMEQSLDTSKSEEKLMNGLRKFVKQKKKSIRLSEAALLGPNEASVGGSLSEDLDPETVPNTCKESEEKSTAEALKDNNEISTVGELEKLTSAQPTCQELNAVLLENKADLHELCDADLSEKSLSTNEVDIHVNSNEVNSSANTQNDYFTVNTKAETVDQQVSSTVLCNSHTENTKAQDTTSKKENASTSTVNENQLSGEDDENNIEKIPNKGVIFKSPESTKIPDGVLATNVFSVISSLALKKLPLTSENLNDSTMTDSNDSYFKSMDNSLDSSESKDQLMNRLRKSVKQKKMSVTLTNATLLTSKESFDSSVCDGPESLINDETSKSNLKENVNNINELKSIPEEINTKDEVPNSGIIESLHSNKDQHFDKIVCDSSIVKSSMCVQRTDEVKQVLFSSQNDLTSTNIKKPSSPSNDTSLKNYEESVDNSPTENPVTVNKKRKSVRLSNAPQIVSKRESIDFSASAARSSISLIDKNNESRSPNNKADNTRSSLDCNDVNYSVASLGLESMDNSSIPSSIENNLPNDDKSNVNHSETAGNTKSSINQDDEVSGTMSYNADSIRSANKKSKFTNHHHETKNDIVPNISFSDAPIVPSVPETVEIQPENNYLDISSHADILNTEPVPSYDTSLENNEESVEGSPTENPVTVNKKRKSVRLSNAPQLVSNREYMDLSVSAARPSISLIDKNNESRSPDDKADSTRSNLVNNDAECIQKSLGLEPIDNSSIPSTIEKNLPDVDKSNVNHNETAVNTKSTVNQDNKVNETTSNYEGSIRSANKKTSLTTRYHETRNQETNISLGDAPVATSAPETVKVQPENNHLVISSHTDFTSADILKKPPSPSNNVSLKNNEESVDISPIENPIRKTVNEKRKSIRLSNASKLVSKRESIDSSESAIRSSISPVDKNRKSKSPIDMAGNSRSNLENNDVEYIQTSLGHNVVDKSKKTSIVGNNLANYDKSNENHNETPGNTKTIINQDNKVGETRSNNTDVIGSANKKNRNNTVSNISLIEAPIPTSVPETVEIQPENNYSVIFNKLRLLSQSTPIPEKERNRIKSNIIKNSESPKPVQVKSNITPNKLVNKKKPKKSVTFNIASSVESEDGASPSLNTFTDVSVIPGEGLRVGGKSKPVTSSPYPISQRKRKQLVEIANQSVTSFSESRRSHKKNISVQVTKEYISSSSSGRLSQSKSPEHFSSKKQSSFENASSKGNILHTSNRRKSINVSSKGDTAHVSHKSEFETLHSNRESVHISHKKDPVNVSNKRDSINISKKKSVNTTHKRGSLSGTHKEDTLNEINLEDSTVPFHPKKKQRIDKSLSNIDFSSKEIDKSNSSSKGNENTLSSKRSTVRSKHYEEDLDTQNVDASKVSMVRRNRALTSITNTEKSRSLRSGSLDSSFAEKSVIFPPKKKARLAEISVEKSDRSASRLRSFSESRRNSGISQLDDSIPLGFSISDDEQSDYNSIFNKHSWLKPLMVPQKDNESSVTASGLDLSGDLMPPPKPKQLVKKNQKLAKPAPWANQKFYKFLFDFFKPRYGIEYRKRSEDFVLFLYPYVQSVVLLNDKKDYSPLVLAVKEKTKELGLCTSIWDYKELCDYLPVEFKYKSYYCGSKRYEPVIDHLASF